MAIKRLTRNDLKFALPDTTSQLSIRGLEGSANIIRDQLGIPHVRARSIHDAFFAQGFATAQDRLWHMDYDRHRAYGRWAELVGPIALEEDCFMRRFRLEASARGDLGVIGLKARDMLEAYSAGVNAFIETTEALPIEYRIVDTEPEPWRPWDCLAVFKMRHIMMGTFESKLWKAKLVAHLGPVEASKLLPSYEEGQLLVVPPGGVYASRGVSAVDELLDSIDVIPDLGDIIGGSNSWVLSGKRTASGKPLLAGDPHRALDTPNAYYQNHVACPELDVIGLSFPGVPGFPHFGHNANMAWCVTHAMADYQDLYIERFKEDDSTMYLFEGRWEKANIHDVKLKVAGGETKDRQVTVTRHGPIIAGDPAKGSGIAFKYTATSEPIKAADAIYQMLFSNSIDEMDEAMREWVDPCNNFLIADINGDIQYITRGKVPIRSKYNAWLPVPGWTGEHEWEGVIPFEEMPRSRNPEDGWIITANHRIVGDEYPYYIGLDYWPDFRARRIQESLSKLNGASAQDMISIHSDDVSIPAQQLVRCLQSIESNDADVEAAKALLLKWDGNMSRDKVEPTIFSAFRDSLVAQVLNHVLGSLSHATFEGTERGSSAWLMRFESVVIRMAIDNDVSLLPPGKSWKSLLSLALSEAIVKLNTEIGTDINTWIWNRLHKTKPSHTLSPSYPDMSKLLDPPSISLSGDGDTPLAGSYDSMEPFGIISTSVARYVFDLSDWSKSGWVVPLGSSGHPGSIHYADQSETWSEVRLFPMLYDWVDIETSVESRQTLNPG